MIAAVESNDSLIARLVKAVRGSPQRSVRHKQLLLDRTVVGLPPFGASLAALPDAGRYAK